MPVSPFLRTPLTDLTGTLLTNQDFGRCTDVEMKTVNCFEAYGQVRGMTKCADLIEDYQECITRHKQNMRFIAMREERERQYKSGERSKEELYAAGPRLDSFE